MTSNKLESFPKVYYINMDHAVERNNYMIDMLKKSGITNYERVVGLKARRSKHPLLSRTQYGCAMAHLQAICKVANGYEEYAVILEDDIDLLASDHWLFTWKEFIDRAPDFDVLQLFRLSLNTLSENYSVKENDFDTMIRFKKWEVGDFMAPAYVISRTHAKRLQKKLMSGGPSLRDFESLSSTEGPVADHMVYTNANTYSASIFTTKVFISQISNQHEWVPYLSLLELFDKEIKNNFTLDRIFTTYESDNESAQA